MNRLRPKNGKVDPIFHQELQEIAMKRFMAKRDRGLLRPSPQLVSRKILRHQLWPQIKKDLEIADFLKDTSGQLGFSAFNIFRFMIVIFVALILFAGYIWVTGLLNNTFTTIGQNNEVNSGLPGYTNLTQASQITFGQMNSSIQGLRLVSITLIFAEILLFFVLNSFARVHPSMFFVYVLIIFLAILFSAPLSNAYESILQSNIFDGQLQTFTAGNWVMLNLPLVVLMVGIFGGIFMFINIVRPGNEQSL